MVSGLSGRKHSKITCSTAALTLRSALARGGRRGPGSCTCAAWIAACCIFSNLGPPQTPGGRRGGPRGRSARGGKELSPELAAPSVKRTRHSSPSSSTIATCKRPELRSAIAAVAEGSAILSRLGSSSKGSECLAKSSGEGRHQRSRIRSALSQPCLHQWQGSRRACSIAEMPIARSRILRAGRNAGIGLAA